MSNSNRPMLLLLAAGLVLMLGAGLNHFMANPDLVQHSQGNTSASAPATPAQEIPDGVMKLMQTLKSDPQNLDALLGLVQHFTHTQDWDKAETFALRASLAKPEDPRPPYLLGIVLHGQGRHAEAAASLEKSLALKADPSVAYSLGVLYAFYLNKPEDGRKQLESVAADPTADPALKKDAADTLTQLNTKKS